MKLIKYSQPDAEGNFGPYGGRNVPAALESRLAKLTKVFLDLRHDPQFKQQLGQLYRDYVNRPSLCILPPT